MSSSPRCRLSPRRPTQVGNLAVVPFAPVRWAVSLMLWQGPCGLRLSWGTTGCSRHKGWPAQPCHLCSKGPTDPSPAAAGCSLGGYVRGISTEPEYPSVCSAGLCWVLKGSWVTAYGLVLHEEEEGPCAHLWYEVENRKCYREADKAREKRGACVAEPVHI